MCALKPIPECEMPQSAVGKTFLDEGLVDLKAYFGDSIYTEPVYYNNNIEGAIEQCFVRLGVAKRLETALSMLPEGITLKIFDSWRPLSVQRRLYNQYYSANCKLHPQWSEAQLAAETAKFVSVPSSDPNNPPVHNTGGAIDLTLADIITGEALPMGTEFDDFTDRAHTAFFERHIEQPVTNNRRILYRAMIAAGFTNLPTEWWHYDYGTGFWSYYTKNPALYGGIEMQR